MVEIPRFKRSVGVPGGAGGDRASPGDFGGTARALGAAAQGMGDVANELDRIQASKEAAWISRATGEAEIYTSELETRLEQEAGEGAPQHVDAFKQDWQQYRAKVIKEAPSRRARSALEVRLNGVETAAIKRRGRFQAGAELAKRGADFDSGLQGHIFAARQNPGNIDQVLARIEGDFDAASMWIPGDQIPELRAQAKAQAVEAAAEGFIANRDFAGARDAVENAQQGGLLDAQQRQVLLNKIEEGEKLAFVDAEAGAITEDMAAASRAQGDTSGLVKAVIRQESGGDPEAVSPKGAVGVMQLMPGTARETAEKLGVEYRPELLKDAQYNKMLGTAYLNDQLETFDGNLAMALAAYNAGPGRVNEWIERFGDPRTGEITTAEWAAKIPFEETRNYVAKIGSNLGGLNAPDEVLADRLNDIEDPAVRLRVQRAALNRWSLGAGSRERAAAFEAAQREEEAARLEIAVNRGEAGYQEIEQAFEAGVIGPGKLTSLTKTLDGEIAGVREARARLAEGESFNVYDKDDRKLADALYKHSDQSTEAAFAITTQTGIAPRPFVAEIRQRTHQGDSEAYELADNLLNRHPLAFDRNGGGEIAKRVDEFRGYTRVGYSSEEAARRASRTDVERANMAAFGQDVTKELARIEDADVLNALPSIGTTFFTPEISDARKGRLRNDFETAYREVRADGVPKDEAMSVAAARLDRIWGLSTVNGEEEVMRFPPERYYPAGPDGHGYIRGQAVADIVEMTGAQPASLRFVSDLVTEGDIRAGQPPRYRLFFVDSDGFPQQIPGYFRADPSVPQQELSQRRKERFEIGRVLKAEREVEAAQQALDALKGQPGGASPELREAAERRLREAQAAIPEDAEEVKAREEQRRRERVEAAQDDRMQQRLDAMEGLPGSFGVFPQ